MLHFAPCIPNYLAIIESTYCFFTLTVSLKLRFEVATDQSWKDDKSLTLETRTKTPYGVIYKQDRGLSDT